MDRRHKEYIQVDATLNYIFYFGLPGTCLYIQVIKNNLSALVEPAPESCTFRTFIKTLSWKSKMKDVVQYEVYLDILLVVFIYVINHFLRVNSGLWSPVLRPGVRVRGPRSRVRSPGPGLPGLAPGPNTRMCRVTYKSTRDL